MTEQDSLEQGAERKGLSRRDFIKAVGIGTAAVAGAVAAPALAAQGSKDVFGPKPDPTKTPKSWDLEYDVVVIGSGAVGLPAAIRARDAGASVLVVETNYDIGGHAITSGGNVPLGGGTSWQRRDGIQDDPDTLFKDLVDWSVTNNQGQAIYKYNDRGIHRVMADNMAPSFEFLLENGVQFDTENGRKVDNAGANGTGISAAREVHTVWNAVHAGRNGFESGCSAYAPAGAGGTLLCRNLEESARKKGVKFLLNYHMDIIYREQLNSGRVLGIQASYTPTILPDGTILQPYYKADSNNIVLNRPAVTVKAKKAIIVGSGGSSGNVAMRRIADPRLTEEVPNSLAEYSPQDGSGELAIMAVGGVLWGTANQTLERWGNLLLSANIGTKNNYNNVTWDENTPVLPRIKYIGVRMRNWQYAIMVNQVGKRFYNEMASTTYPAATANGFAPFKDGYTHGDWKNIAKVPYTPVNYVDAALAINEGSTPENDFAAGPQWAIFDQECADFHGWDLTPAYRMDPERFFKANTLEELAAKINSCPEQKYKMNAAVLKATIDRYNSFVDSGTDDDFGKASPQFKIETGPFYAAWNTVQLHDTYMGVRVNGKCQVVSLEGQPIPGLYAGGECTGGASAHGLARCIAQGYIAGYEAARA
jgi:predicted oxidoreductase